MKRLIIVVACLATVAAIVFVVASFIWWRRLQETPPSVPAMADLGPQKDGAQPNFYVQVSAGLVNARLEEPVDRTAPMHEVILGTDISGTSHMTGRATAQFALDTEAAAIDIIFRSTAESQTVGEHRPVTIDSDGTTSIAARKRILISADGIKALPAEANAVTHTTTTGVEAKHRIVERIAERRIDRERPRSDRLVAENTEKTVDHNMDQQIDKMVAEADDAFQKKLCEPLRSRGLFPGELLFSTTKESLRVGALWAKGEQPTPATAPPALDPSPDVGVQLHESFVNNLAAAELAGQKLQQATVWGTVTRLLGSLPKRFDSDGSNEPWAIKFAVEKPITLRFDNDSVEFTIRAQEFIHGDTKYPGMDVSGGYKFELANGEVKAVRQGNIRIRPPGESGDDRLMSIPAAIICDILDYWFSDVLTKQIVGKGFTPRGKWSHIGTFQPIQLAAKDGWLVVGWKRVPEQKAPEGASGE